MIACPECGQPLEPIQINGSTHTPHCWHPHTEEVYGTEMGIDKAIELATWHVEEHEEEMRHAQGILGELRWLKRQGKT